MCVSTIRVPGFSGISDHDLLISGGDIGTRTVVISLTCLDSTNGVEPKGAFGVIFGTNMVKQGRRRSVWDHGGMYRTYHALRGQRSLGTLIFEKSVNSKGTDV